jgi:integrase
MPIEARKRKKGTRYVVRVLDRESHWFPTKTFLRMVDAEVYERELLTRRDYGTRAISVDLRNIHFKDYFLRWANECRGKVSDGWKDSQDRMAKNYLFPHLGNLKLNEISGPEINRVLNKMREKKLAAATVRHAYVLLRKIFEDAIDEHELLLTNPIRKKYRPVVHQKERDFLKPGDAWKLLEASRHDSIGPAVWIATLAGLRAGEIQALKVKAVDFDHNQILIRATFCRRSMTLQDHPKQGDWGKVPMVPPLREYLQIVTAGRGADEFVLRGERNEMLSHNAFLRNLTRLCKQTGVKRVTPHELRHSCTEIFVQNGASQEDLRRLLNHSSLSATQKYIHRTDDRLNALAASIERPDQGPRLRLVGK